MIFHMISYLISYFVLTVYALQPPQISVLMQATLILTLTYQWISTRSVDRDMEEDAQNIATLMRHMPSCCALHEHSSG